VILASAAAACSAPATEEKKLPPVNPEAASLRQGFTTMDRLIETAKKEGSLTVVGLPRGWVNYGEIIDRFADEYDVKVTVTAPDASSQQEIDAAARLKNTPQAPDVFDLSMDVAVANARMFAPYKVTGWQDIPDDLKDPKGYWYAAYGGYMSIGYDPRKMTAPTSFADLRRPGVSVALPGDPLRIASAFSGVMAASLSGGRPDARRGLDFFAELKKSGGLGTPDQATAVLDWDYLNAARAAGSVKDDKPTWQVTVPGGAVLASYYAQAINADAPHPAAARLWQEFLFSDEVQNLYLKGFARPVRTEAMEMRGKLDEEAAARLPRVTGTPVVLTVQQQDAARSYLKSHWAHRMGS
jgi:putative spermidine/putrescine transport system substrate-binding protein